MLLGFIFYVIGQPSFDTYIVYSASCIGTLTVIVMAYGILRSLKLK